MKISIITVCYNSEATIRSTLESVKSQTYPLLEHIIVDGGSSDSTLNILKQYDHISTIISEPDHGIYDALNKGIKIAKGDIIGILHSDDVFAKDDIIAMIAKAFEDDAGLEAVYGDVAFVSRDQPDKIVRYYSSFSFSPARFIKGYMPAHPSFFCRKELFAKYGYYRSDMKIGADFDLLLRFMAKHKIRSKYLPVCTTVMTMGGESTSGIQSLITINRDFYRSLKEHGFKASYLKLYARYFFKWKEFFVKPSKL